MQVLAPPAGAGPHAAPGAPPAVRLLGIHKHFGPVHANRGVNLSVAAGTVHGLVGENGAGKSTLMSILYGLLAPDAGTLEVSGAPVRLANPRQARALGIGMVHQHFMLVDGFTVLDNLLVGGEGPAGLAAARAAMRSQVQALMRATGLHVPLDEPVQALPVGARQRVEILKALLGAGAHGTARVLILDEPTAVLTPQETHALFDTLRRLREQGTTVLLITHKLKEILALCDAVTVMRAGQVVLDAPVAEVTLDSLAQAMVGRRVAQGRPSATPVPEGTEPLLRAEGLVWRDALGVARLSEVSLQLRPGEIVGVAGVSGNGQSELLEVLSGLLVPQHGSLALQGRTFTPGRWLEPRQARALGLAHVPEDRHRRGLVLPFEAWESAVLGYERRPAFGRGPWLPRSALREACAALMRDWDVRPPRPGLASGRFSGGNQQKLVLGREARAEPRVLLVGQPTRGVDIGAIEFIHARLRALRDAGGAVLVVSSELDEILALADRVLVMCGGRITGERPVAECDEAGLGRLMGAGATV